MDIYHNDSENVHGYFLCDVSIHIPGTFYSYTESIDIVLCLNELLDELLNVAFCEFYSHIVNSNVSAFLRLVLFPYFYPHAAFQDVQSSIVCLLFGIYMKYIGIASEKLRIFS